jgi:hypothetical protein
MLNRCAQDPMLVQGIEHQKTIFDWLVITIGANDCI